MLVAQDFAFIEYDIGHFKRIRKHDIWREHVTSYKGNSPFQANGKREVYCQYHFEMASSNTQEFDVLDSWEDIEDSDVLERKFSHMRTTSQSSKCSMSTNGAPFKIILTGDDPIRSQYVPVEPTVTILKRPSKLNHNVTETKVILPKKTLKQREQEYAEARLRILGEAQCSEKVPSDPSSRFTCIQNKLPEQQQRNVTVDENVIRMPKGPDGTKGFERR